MKAGPLAGVAGRARRLDEGHERVAVAVIADRLTVWVLPEVAPLCHSSSRERLKKWISPVSRVRRNASEFM